MVEADLADALEQGTIAAAGLDVLSVEPMREDNPLRRIKDSERLVITPHVIDMGGCGDTQASDGDYFTTGEGVF